MSRYTKEEIEKLFIESPQDLTISEIARRTGRSKSVVHYWINKNHWNKRRQEFWDGTQAMEGHSIAPAVKKATQDLSKIQEILNLDAASLALEHLVTYQKFRKFSELILSRIIKKVNESPDPIAEMKNINIKDINLLSQISDRSIKGESASIALHLQINPSMAIASLESMGYVVIDPTDSIETIPTD